MRAPSKAELACKQKAKVNRQKQRTSNVRAKTSTAPKLSTLARIREFHDKHFKDTVTDKGSIFCETCCEEIPVKRSTILNHIKARKHLAGKEKLGQKKQCEKDLVEILRAHDDKNHPLEYE